MGYYSHKEKSGSCVCIETRVTRDYTVRNLLTVPLVTQLLRVAPRPP